MITHDSPVKKFYEAFQRRDFRAMQAMYDESATFSDPVFDSLNAEEVRAMWEMLLSSSADLRVEFSIGSADAAKGVCRWDAWYTFSKTRRPVHNIITSTMTLRNGKIFEHRDSFDFWKWSRQAFGHTGWVLGWTPWFQRRVRATARERLHKFIASKK